MIRKCNILAWELAKFSLCHRKFPNTPKNEKKFNSLKFCLQYFLSSNFPFKINEINLGLVSQNLILKIDFEIWNYLSKKWLRKKLKNSCFQKLIIIIKLCEKKNILDYVINLMRAAFKYIFEITTCITLLESL